MDSRVSVAGAFNGTQAEKTVTTMRTRRMKAVYAILFSVSGNVGGLDAHQFHNVPSSRRATGR
ncbi:hypothetical protein OKW42_003936 [Paraburkholderia sp. WC7.3d]